MNKSYPQFNLKTLQLPAPASSMTKAEYKEAYGIDLDETDIKAFKLVLFGNDKFSIDQIKEVEGGYDIYFNGRILSITDSIQTSNEVYNVANSKPIYLHPITISNLEDTNYSCRLSIMIFNNSSISFTKTSLISYLKSIPQASMLVTGSYRGDLTGTPYYLSPAYIYYASSLTPTPKIALVGIDNLGVSHTSANNIIDVESMLNSDKTEIYDGVNKIN